MKEIICKKGEKVIVSDCDYPLLSQFKWTVVNEKGYLYAKPRMSGAKMHRIIMGTSFDPKIFIDHKDGNGLNNQRSNLRTCTNMENVQNQRKRKNNTTGYKGVYKNMRGKYEVRCTSNGKTKYGGCYTSAMEAASVYDKLSIEMHGEFSRPNHV